MSEFRAEKPENNEKMKEMSEAKASDGVEIPVVEAKLAKTTSTGSDWKARLAAMKIKAVAPKQDKTPSSVPTEKLPHQVHDEAEAKIGKAQIEQEELKRQSDVVLNAEALFIESLGERSDDRDELFKTTFVNKIQEVVGLNLDEIRDRILAAQRVIYDNRVGIQAWLAYRGEVLKEASSEERQKRLKEDFAFKAPKTAKANGSPKSSKGSVKKEKFDPFAAMKRTLIEKFVSKGMSLADATAKAEKKVAAFGDES